MNSPKALAVLNLIGLIFTLTINGLANALPLNGIQTGEISDMFPNLFVPAGLTFSIWGIIFLLLIIFVVYGLIQAFKTDGNTRFLTTIGPWFFFSCIFNGAWLLAWHHFQLPLSILIMLALLISLTVIYLRLDIGKNQPDTARKFLVQLPFSIYLGWITVATIANITAFLSGIRWSGWGISEPTWTIAMIVVAVILMGTMFLTRRDPFYGLSIGWALLGIYLRRTWEIDDMSPIAWVAIIGAGISVLILLAGVLQKRLY